MLEAGGLPNPAFPAIQAAPGAHQLPLAFSDPVDGARVEGKCLDRGQSGEGRRPLPISQAS